MKIRESAEDYLESIYMLQMKNGYARSVDIATQRQVTKASVSIAMKQLRENDYISMASDGSITLKDKGMEIAQRIYERHNVLTKMFVALGVDEETAAQDACKIEHSLSDTTFNAIKNHVKNQAKA